MRRPRDRLVGGDRAIAVREWPGDGPAVLLLHGLAHNLEVWTPVAGLLPRENRVVAMDLRGHGRSETSPGHSYADHAADVATVMDAVGIDRAVIAGHSWGARVALFFAATCGERCRGVVAVDQALWDYDPPPHYLADVVLGPLHPTVLSDEEADALRHESRNWGRWAPLVERSLERSPGGWVQRPVPSDVRALTLAEARSQPVEQLYADITCPIVMLFAADDEDFGFARPVGRPANVEHLAAVVPSARIGWVDGDHGFLVDDPAPVAAAIVGLLPGG